MNRATLNKGFTLLEVMIVIAIIGIISAIALPAYNDYVKRTKIAIAEQNAEGLRSTLEDYWIDNRTYVAGEWSSGGAKTLETMLGWRPGDTEVLVTVVAGATGIANSYTIAAWHEDAADAADKVTISYSR